jgi:hypothetical protein
MSVAFKEIETQAFTLDRNERMILGQELIQSTLDSEETDQEKAWYDEAERRLAAIESGKMKTYPGPEVVDKLIARLSGK